jgi:hypothetical protein
MYAPVTALALLPLLSNLAGTCRFQLEQRILELESGRLEHHVRAEDYAALKDERDRLAGQLRLAADAEARLQRQLEAEKEQVRV